ncbi:ABC-type transporter, integral membrane subunit [Pseudobacteroides cellulosolvens ATCC 35603 = DSM 2933]|uniref:ABC-type transporter, integral membrane subunit n=2 Tax=Pseudobacteroides cellulosolvens TaxID=35825 RepID=A0A0L6JV00_9FIRM|nr:iron ABC transporter permease [Pseudobacteroides cellulosolvens]KNY29480.1 ABC-type transporter, integral membrane subunit [Pseudobacteroides cellulosolvens ATCC 35603 = DSM 2933]
MNHEKTTVNGNGRTVMYNKYTLRKRGVVIMLFILIIIASIFAINAGSTNLNVFQVIQAFMGNGTEVSDVVIWQIRLPRVLAAIIAGAGLSVAGCIMQNNLRNPLASPSTLGISNAAAFGANLAIIVFGTGSIQSTGTDAVIINNPYLVTVSAFVWAMIGTVIILMLGRFRGFSPEAMVLAGVALSSLFSAGTILIQYFAQDIQIAAAVFWTFGDLGRASWREVAILASVIFLAIVYFILRRWDYNALDSGEETAKSLGVHVENVRMGGMFISSLITAVAVSFLGIIGFIGLIGPQIIRRIVGVDYRFLIPASALTGSLLLLVSDTLARSVVSPVVLPVGAITSFFGAPLFLYLLVRGYKKK